MNRPFKADIRADRGAGRPQIGCRCLDLGAQGGGEQAHNSRKSRQKRNCTEMTVLCISVTAFPLIIPTSLCCPLITLHIQYRFYAGIFNLSVAGTSIFIQNDNANTLYCTRTTSNVLPTEQHLRPRHKLRLMSYVIKRPRLCWPSSASMHLQTDLSLK